MTCYIGPPGAGIEYELPDRLVHADPRIRVVDSFVWAAARPGGAMAGRATATGTKVGALVRFVFSDCVLVYVLRQVSLGVVEMEWPD